PAVQAEHPHLQARREQRLHERLAGLEILAANRDAALASELEQRRRVRGQVRCAISERNTRFQRGVSVDLARRDLRIVLHQPAFEILKRLMNRAGTMEYFGGSAPDHHLASAVILLAELGDVVY